MSLLQDVLRPTNPRDVDLMAARLNKLSVPDDSPSSSPRVRSPALGIDSSDEDELIGVVSTVFFSLSPSYRLSIRLTHVLLLLLRPQTSHNQLNPRLSWLCVTYLRSLHQGHLVVYNLEAHPEVHLLRAATAKGAALEPLYDVFLALYTYLHYLPLLPRPNLPSLKQTL